MTDDHLPRGVAQMDLPEVHVHFDGACQPPKGPGVAAFGFTIDGPGLSVEEGGLATRPYSEHSTNNVAEYVAAIRALEWLLAHDYRGRVIAWGDSQLVVRQMLGEYAVRTAHLQAYHERLRQLAGHFASVTWRWIPRDQNGRADELSKRAILDAAPEARRHRPVGMGEGAAVDEAEPSDDEPAPGGPEA